MAELTGSIPNRFRAFNNMTYSVSLYLQDHKHYAAMVADGTKDVAGMELLIQSGGASTDEAGTGNYGAKRNKFFTRDFYLDDIQLQSYIAGTTTGGPQNSFEMNFTVTEPMGLTFLERLNNASVTHAKEVLKIENFNPVNQIYLAVIRFYGYDENGNQVLNGKFDDGSDPNSYIEKWIPFMMKRVSFAIESSKVVYSCECVCPQTQVGQGQIHGTIPSNLGLQGATLKDILDGTDKANNTGGTVTQGLMAALNAQQEQLRKDEKYDFANKYAIEFEPGEGLDTAEMGAFRTSQVARSGTAAGMSTGAATQAGTGTAKAISKVHTLSTNAGMKITKFIDLAIRSSDYMSKQYKKVNDANKDKSTEHRPTASNKPLNWFKVRPRVKVIDFDHKRQAWAYEITYVVTVYPVASVETNDFTSERCFKPHKEYDFWFTGNNTEVLEFKQDFNSFYFTTFDAKHKENPKLNPSVQTNIRAQRTFRPVSSEAQTGENLTDEQAANAASILYAPQDIANCEIDILGDPDWLAQSELFYAANANPGEAVLNDGSINYDKSEVYFTVNFNTVVDYDLDTGLADVTQKNVTENLDGSHPGGVSQYAFIYRANTITSQLAKGKFTQKLLGTLVFIPETCITGHVPEDNN